MKEAIQKAVEGGFEPTIAERECCDDINFYHTQYKLLCDPLFWQCLGKAIGKYGRKETYVPRSGEVDIVYSDNEQWFDGWHDFITHLSKGGNPDNFFKELLNQN